jgi:hypothetical protein
MPSALLRRALATAREVRAWQVARIRADLDRAYGAASAALE